MTRCWSAKEEWLHVNANYNVWIFNSLYKLVRNGALSAGISVVHEWRTRTCHAVKAMVCEDWDFPNNVLVYVCICTYRYITSICKCKYIKRRQTLQHTFQQELNVLVNTCTQGKICHMQIVNACVYVCMCLCVSMCVHMYRTIYIYIYIYIYICIYMYVCMYKSDAWIVHVITAYGLPAATDAELLRHLVPEGLASSEATAVAQQFDSAVLQQFVAVVLRESVAVAPQQPAYAVAVAANAARVGHDRDRAQVDAAPILPNVNFDHWDHLAPECLGFSAERRYRLHCARAVPPKYVWTYSRCAGAVWRRRLLAGPVCTAAAQTKACRQPAWSSIVSSQVARGARFRAKFDPSDFRRALQATCRAAAVVEAPPRWAQ